MRKPSPQSVRGIAKKTASRARYKSDAFGSIHESAAALLRVGAIDKATMRTFDTACVEAPKRIPATRIKALRERLHMSQPVFAVHLNASPSTVAQWESGAKHPTGMALKLLDIVEKHGIEILR
ncbi:MAG: DNA-binding transcriptional regulator [Gemmatimonadaceae bacterium]